MLAEGLESRGAESQALVARALAAAALEERPGADGAGAARARVHAAARAQAPGLLQGRRAAGPALRRLRRLRLLDDGARAWRAVAAVWNYDWVGIVYVISFV